METPSSTLPPEVFGMQNNANAVHVLLFYKNSLYEAGAIAVFGEHYELDMMRFVSNVFHNAQPVRQNFVKFGSGREKIKISAE